MQGSVSGLTAGGLTLSLNNTEGSLSPAAGATTFAFTATLAAGKPYTVAIQSQPTGLTCELTNAMGIVSTTSANSVAVACVPRGSAPTDYNVLLGSPTGSSVTASVLAAPGASVYVEYGTSPASPGKYGSQTAAVTPPASQTTNPVATVMLTGLSPNTRYYYRVNVRAEGASTYVPGDEHAFWTQRAPGSTFSFGVQGDSHPERAGKMFHTDLYKLTMDEVAKRQPDLYFMLGDDFSYEQPIANFKGAYCAQFNFVCANTSNSPTHLFSQAVEGKLNVNAFSLYNSLTTKFIQANVGENVDGVLDAKTRGYGTYLEQRQKYLNRMAHSTSLFMVNGNHEQAHYANLGGLFNNPAVWAADARNKFYPQPAPTASGFYTGDTTSYASGVNGFPGVAGDGLLRDYYAFTWGDALFVTIDPYWHSPFSPDSNLFDAVANNAEPAADQTIGDEQYQWLKRTLEGSSAKYKFIFQHHINGAGRGAASMITTTEWGGASKTGFSFAANRASWAKPLHQLLVDTKTPGGQTIVFQGHDHTYSREMVDGIVYQEVPNPGDNSYWAYNCSAYAPSSIASFTGPWRKADGSAYGVYDPAYSVVRPDTGYLNVTVSPTSVRIDYIRTYRGVDVTTDANKTLYDSLAGRVNGETDFSYSLPANPAIDSATAAYQYTCKGDAPPANFVYNP